VLTGSPGLVKRELDAIRLYREINHPCLIRILHAKQEEDTLFYVMPWCEGTLAQKKILPEELLPAAKDLADALKALHQKDLIHRDIKPDNIFLCSGKPVLGDIGLITQQRDASFAGSPGFLAPELLKGAAPSPYSDCYALAMSLYCILSGNPPERFPLYEGTLSPAAAVLMRTILAVCADHARIRTADEFLQNLHLPPKKRNHTAVIIAGLVTVTVLAAGAVFLPIASEIINEPSHPAHRQRLSPIELPTGKSKQTKKRQSQPDGTQNKEKLPDRMSVPPKRQSQPGAAQKKDRQPSADITHGSLGGKIVPLPDPDDLLNDDILQEKPFPRDRDSYEKIARVREAGEVCSALAELGPKIDWQYAELAFTDEELKKCWLDVERIWRVHLPEITAEITKRAVHKNERPVLVLHELQKQDPMLFFFSVTQQHWLQVKKAEISADEQTKKETEATLKKETRFYLKSRKSFIQNYFRLK